MPGTRVERAAQVVPHLPIVENGPPGTTVIFAGGRRVPLPTDQIVSVEPARDAGVRVGFGGMAFEGLVGDELVFRLVGYPEPRAQVYPRGGARMTLEPYMVESVTVDGRVIWPAIH